MSVFLCLIFCSIIFAFLNLKFSYLTPIEELFENNDLSMYQTDIFQSIFNKYNPYIKSYTTCYELLSNKCYFTFANIGIILDYINNILKLLNMVQIDYNTQIDTVQNYYITGFVNNLYKFIRSTNHLFYYHNDIININVLTQYLIKYLVLNDNDDYSWIELIYLIVINNNVVFLKDVTDYNKILLIAEYILEELKKYSIYFFLLQKKNVFVNDITIETKINSIKNRLFYGNSTNYFTVNNIFDCIK